MYVTPVIPEPPDFAAIVVRRETGSGHATLRVDEGWLQKHNVPVIFHLARICRHDATAGQWQRLPPADMRRVWRLAPLSPQDASKGNRVAFELPQEVALFWLQCGEQNDGEWSEHSLRDALVTSNRSCATTSISGRRLPARLPHVCPTPIEPKRASCLRPWKPVRGKGGIRDRRSKISEKCVKIVR